MDKIPGPSEIRLFESRIYVFISKRQTFDAYSINYNYYLSDQSFNDNTRIPPGGDMRTARNGMTTVLFFPAVIMFFVFANSAAGFHSGGVGDCSGCHTSHTAGGGNPSLLVSTDPSSTCLTCHLRAGENVSSMYHVSTADADMPNGIPPAQMTPGGDFGWIKKNYRWNETNGASGGQSSGERHGHNIVAAAYGFTADAANSTAPGGTYPSAKLSCTSCHDPHGRYRRSSDGTISSTGLPILDSGSYKDSPDPTATSAVGVYRLLGGQGYQGSGTGETFNFNPPAAVSPADYNRSESSSDTRVAYGSGMSEWCTNCHSTYIGTGNAPGHPAGNQIKMTSRAAANYNSYIASGNVTGSSSSSYASIVPYEMGASDYSRLKNVASTDGSMKTGPDTNSNVMCLTCHRAHASAWDHATRWNMKANFLVYDGDYPGTDRSDVPASLSQGRTKVETRRAYYDRPATLYANYQRSLCNKCHTMD